MAKVRLAGGGSGAPRLLQVAGILALFGLALFAADLYGQRSRWQRPDPSSGGSPAAATSAAAAAANCIGGGGAANAAGDGIKQDDSARIPKILHRVFLSGRENFDTLRNNPASSIKAEWDDFCRLVHERAGWRYMFWDADAVDKLIAEDYAWFQPVWDSYTTKVLRGDAARYFIMHKHGGLYLDMDVQCYREGYDLLEGKDVVLQGTHPSEGLTNAVVASAAGHPFWPFLFKVMEERKGGQGGPIHATGPGCITEAMVRLKIVELPPPPPEGQTWETNPFLGTWRWNDTTMEVYPTGTWYTPCWFTDGPCRQKEDENMRLGLYKQEIVGYHRYSGTWNRADDDPDPAHQGALEKKP